MNNQRIANLHYVLDELDRLYTAIQNGILLDPNQSRKQLIESYQSQRSQFMDILSFILPPISTPNTSMMSMLPSITAADASMFPSCIEQPVESDQDELNENQIKENRDGQNVETTNSNNIGTELNPESHEFVPTFGAPTIDTIGPLQQIMPTQSLPSITSALSVPSIHSAQSLPSIHSESTTNNYLPNINDLSNNNNNYLTEPGRHSMDILEHQQSITTTISSGFVSPTTNMFETNVNNNNNGNNINFNNNQSKIDTNSSYQPSVIDTNSNEQYNEYEYSDSDDDEDENNINGNNNINYHGQNNINYQQNNNMNNMVNQNNGDNQIYDQIQQQQQSLQFQDNNNHVQFKYADNGGNNNNNNNNNNNRPEKLSKKLASLRPDPPNQPDYQYDNDNNNVVNYNDNNGPYKDRHNKNNNYYHHHNHRKNQHRNYHKSGHHHSRHKKNQRNNYNQHHRGTYYKKRQQTDDNRNGMNEEQKYDYDSDDEDEDYTNTDNQSQKQKIDENDPLLGSSPFPHNEIQPGQQIIVPLKPKIVSKPPTVIDLDPTAIEASKKKVIYESAAKREKVIKSQIGHLLKFYKCGIDEDVFMETYQNYYGFRIELKYLPKCNAWNDFLLRCTWRKQININNRHYIYSKYKSQYPHIFAIKQCGNHLINESNDKDVLKLMDLMLESLECGVIRNHVVEVFQLFFGKKLTGQSKSVQEYFDRHCLSATLYTFSGHVPVTDKIFISQKRLQKLTKHMITSLRRQLLELFFYRSPSGILKSELAYVYRQKYKSAMYLVNITLNDFIATHLNEYIESCQTNERKTLYYFRSYMGLPHTITKLLKSVDLETRCGWIRDKVKQILSLYKQGIEWKCLVKAVLLFGSFQLSQWLFTTQESPPSCIQLLQQTIPELDIKIGQDSNMKICYLKSNNNSSSKKKKHFAPAIAVQDIYGYHDLVVNLLKDDADKAHKNNENMGLFVEQIESKFNTKYDKFRLIVETPLVMNQISDRIDQQIWKEYKRLKYDPYQFMNSQRPKHWKHPYRNYKKHNDENMLNYNQEDEEKKQQQSFSAKWIQKERNKENVNDNNKRKDRKNGKEKSLSPNSQVSSQISMESKESNSSSSLPPGAGPDDLHKGDICIIHGLSTNKGLNGVSVKLKQYIEDRGRWKVMITSSSTAGDMKLISPNNLKRMDLNTRQHEFKKVNPIKPDATKISFTNLSKATSRKHVIYKLEKSFGVKILYCSDVIDDPYNSKANFIPKLEFESAEQVSSLVRSNELHIDKQMIKIINYVYKYENYKDILSKMVQIITEQRMKNKKVFINELYNRYKEEDFKEAKKLSIIEFCQLIEHDSIKLYIEKNMIRLVKDQKVINTEKLAKMVEDVFDTHYSPISSNNKWSISTFKRKWAQKFHTNLKESTFGKYRSFVHFLNDAQQKYRIDILHSRKLNANIKFSFTQKNCH